MRGSPWPQPVRPRGTPFDTPEYKETTGQISTREAPSSTRHSSPRRPQVRPTRANFVLVTVVMATVMFFAGVGTKLQGRGIRVVCSAPPSNSSSSAPSWSHCCPRTSERDDQPSRHRAGGKAARDADHRRRSPASALEVTRDRPTLRTRELTSNGERHDSGTEVVHASSSRHPALSPATQPDHST